MIWICRPTANQLLQTFKELQLFILSSRSWGRNLENWIRWPNPKVNKEVVILISTSLIPKHPTMTLLRSRMPSEEVLNRRQSYLVGPFSGIWIILSRVHLTTCPIVALNFLINSWRKTIKMCILLFLIWHIRIMFLRKNLFPGTYILIWMTPMVIQMVANRQLMISFLIHRRCLSCRPKSSTNQATMSTASQKNPDL